MWSKDIPTKEGYYWIRELPGKAHVIYLEENGSVQFIGNPTYYDPRTFDWEWFSIHVPVSNAEQLESDCGYDPDPYSSW